MSQPCIDAELCTVPLTAPRRVLIIDDDATLAAVLERGLRRHGFETLAATAGEPGLRLARKERPALILLDIGLPDADGLALCRQLVDDPMTADIPVMILSGSDRPDVVRAARAAGCHYFVRKPCDPSVLLVLAREAIDESQWWDQSDALAG